MKIQDFGIWVNEQKEEESRSEEISFQKFISLLKRNCKNFKPQEEGPLIYRRKQKGNFQYIDPRKEDRKFWKGDVSWANVIFDLSPIFTEFPRRKTSVIGNCSLKHGQFYGSDTYYVIPFDVCEIGVYNDTDFGYGINFLTNNGMIDIRKFLMGLWKVYNEKELKMETYPDIKKICDELQEKHGSLNAVLKKLSESQDLLSLELNSLLRPFQKTLEVYDNDKRIWDITSEMLSDINEHEAGCRKYSSEEFFREKLQKNSSSEVWTDGPCLLINKKHILEEEIRNIHDPEIIKGLKKQMIIKKNIGI